MINTTTGWGVFFRDWRRLAGGASIMIGVLFLLGELFGIDWIAYLAIFLIGLILLAWGGKSNKDAGTISGSVLMGVGGGLLFGFGLRVNQPIITQVGMLLCGLGAGFGFISLVFWIRSKKFLWWPLFPAAIIGSLGACMVAGPARLLDFVLYLSVGLGITFLWVGLVKRLLGLIIPGCLLLGSGPGVYMAWGTKFAPNALAQTGLMLVCIAFGWIIITVFSRVATEKFVWWPLIPGGILAMVGWGLYIGGSPENAASFIGNTGSVGLIVIGLYLLLMRQGIRK